MVGGSNTNVRYRGRMFHVQTEDSGASNPKIITLLYEGGVILYSKKRSYEEIVESAEVEDLVRDLMEVQHREMLKALKHGDLDVQVGLEIVGGPTEPGDPAAARVPSEFGDGLISSKPLDELILGHLGAK